MPELKDLHKYQLEEISYIVENETWITWQDMGMGKTVSAATAVTELLWLGEVKHVLVLAPKKVAENTWPNEFEDWNHLNHMIPHLTVATNLTAAKRKLAVNALTKITVINIENLLWLIAHWGGKNWPYDMVVFDEYSKFKRLSKRTKAAIKLRWGKGSAGFGRMVGLTATPMSNGVEDLFTQYKLADRGIRLGKTKGEFQEMFMQMRWVEKKTKHGMKKYPKWVGRDGSLERITDLVSDITSVLRAHDHLDMPPLVERVITIDIPDAARKQMDKLSENGVLELPDGSEIWTEDDAGLNAKLHQYANGAVYVGDPLSPDYQKGDWREVHSAKIDMLVEMMEATDKNTIISYWFKSDLARIKKALPEAVHIDEPNAIRRWNKGEIKYLLVHPASAGHGLNLQHGGCNMVVFSLFWDAEVYLQLLGRIYRQGQKEPVTILKLAVRNTIEQALAQSLDFKIKKQETLIEMVKNYDQAA